MPDLTTLQTVWFVATGVVWALYLVLGGADLGVGMLVRRVSRDHHDRRVALHVIGPTWAANDVWVVIGVVAMLAAFPGWYAAWTSALYVPLVVVLLAVIARNAGIELISKRDGETWRRRWERTVVVASAVAPFCWGLLWSAAVDGIALRDGAVVAGPLEIVTPYAVLGGLAVAAVARAHGAAYLALRTDGAVRRRATEALRGAVPTAAVLGGGFLAWTVAAQGPGIGGAVAAAACAVALAVAVGAGARGRSTVAFGAGCAAIAALVATWFGVLFPTGIAAADGGTALALADVAAGEYTLTLLTILAAVGVPALLVLQGWVHWLFRHRISRADVGADDAGGSGGAGDTTGGGRSALTEPLVPRLRPRAARPRRIAGGAVDAPAPEDGAGRGGW